MVKKLNKIPTEILSILQSVTDPEIPVLTIVDLGVIHKVEVDGNNIYVELMPTYTGCPAMDVMQADIKHAFKNADYTVTTKLVLSPAWTSDRITEKGKAALKAYGIAPPLNATADKSALLEGAKLVACTNCSSTNTTLVSQFGSTACKALFKCLNCLEPFDYFKCLK